MCEMQEEREGAGGGRGCINVGVSGGSSNADVFRRHPQGELIMPLRLYEFLACHPWKGSHPSNPY